MIDLPEKDMKRILEGLKAQVLSLVDLGNTCVVDESVMDYYGKDMVDAGMICFMKARHMIMD